ncbi:Outer membrane protein assembly factor BamB, contains PQQ-like beta-propeller repeat [Meinhardsimonia xiamenensis]|uniref:Outer membrane protein assembly factor BamB, contains PQQ-like beta-propeller repeat n=1 Tax=Meinhardsimonia xiamenensis TaxID=990712 RepID=A0A1G9FDU5_9RHOB|nr:PQQ-like beta-propeller repeat protein [Meinhardsimonia xiamenensis]PRX37888.1 outer membrane protein assembly factor BamB [Meinhardsimonia xiamenensis]SDK86558.1 Outer membrane protein assembly factor BamB, contains PQQ-like beta-propeller repeat [Meinhardsimonia xiamenensis]
MVARKEGLSENAGGAGRGLTRALGVAALLALAACGQGEDILPGERLNIRPELAEAAPIGAMPFSAPAPEVNRAWSQRGGNAAHHQEHLALARELTRLWSADIGAGNSRKHRITAQPVVAGGRIYTLDARATVTATTSAGETLWQADLTPPSDRAGDASGGGLAVSGDTVFATSGFGRLVALDAATGAQRWVQELEAPATGAPTVHDGLVYVATRDSRGVAVRADNGRVVWELTGIESLTGVGGGASPAIGGSRVVFPFPSGELVAALRQGGVRLWSSVVGGRRKGRAYANLSDIAADPVVAGETVYVANASGRAVALDLNSGERIWTARAGTVEPVWVAGGSVFMVTDLNELVRLDAATGALIWKTELPFYRRENPRRRETITAHWGPVLAGGRLLLVSSDGRLRSFDPETGEALGALELPAGAAAGVAIADATLYVVTSDGRLHAYR